MIEIRPNDGLLLLYYTVENQPYDWVQKELDEHGRVTIARIFSFVESDLRPTTPSARLYPEDEEEDTYAFLLATDSDPYYRIEAAILRTQFDVLLSKQLSISRKTFIANRGISIFSKIDQLVSEPIVVGDGEENAIPISEFYKLLKHFPTTTELNHYAHSRISLILKNYLETTTDAEKKLNNYLIKKPVVQSAAEMPAIYEYEVEKYEYIRDVIKSSISQEKSYSENDWQSLILKFILLIFPKYVAVLKNIKIKDYYSKNTVTKRYIDIALVDSNGNLDVIEIKKPFDDCVISEGKYRDNYTPKKELSGAIMQAEKYIFHLSKWGQAGEKELSATHAGQLPSEMTIKITNPKAIIILGRSKDFASDQNFDFEIIKRKYANIVDIITYDDLLGRLDNTIEQFKRMA